MGGNSLTDSSRNSAASGRFMCCIMWPQVRGTAAAVASTEGCWLRTPIKACTTWVFDRCLGQVLAVLDATRQEMAAWQWQLHGLMRLLAL